MLLRNNYINFILIIFFVICIYKMHYSAVRVLHHRKIQAKEIKKVKIMKKSNPSKSYEILCSYKGKNGKSICDKHDEKQMGKIVKNVYLDMPSKKSYNFRKQPPELNGQIGVPKIVDDLLGNKKNGFYIESGGYDGEQLSNSLFFELQRNYRGLLVEPNKSNYKKLRLVHRKAYSVNACYSTTGLPMLVDFVNANDIGSIKKFSHFYNNKQKEKYQGDSKALCLSFYSILLAVGNPVVDYFSLDIEGAESSVLKTIPWEKVNIKVLSIECGTIARCKKIGDFMKSVGYTIVRYVPSEDFPQDIICKKKS